MFNHSNRVDKTFSTKNSSPVSSHLRTKNIHDGRKPENWLTGYHFVINNCVMRTIWPCCVKLRSPALLQKKIKNFFPRRVQKNPITIIIIITIKEKVRGKVVFNEERMNKTMCGIVNNNHFFQKLHHQKKISNHTGQYSPSRVREIE